MMLAFRCGHRGTFRENQVPQCPECGEQGIARAMAPPPRFTGTATGPHVTTQALEPITVNLASAGPLKLTPKAPEAKTHG